MRWPHSEFQPRANPRKSLSSVDGSLGGTGHKEPPDSLPRHHPVGSAPERDGLEDPRSSRTIGNASRLALGLPGRVGDRLQDQASSVVVSVGSSVKVSPGRLRRAASSAASEGEYQPSEGRPKSILIAGLQTHAARKSAQIISRRKMAQVKSGSIDWKAVGRRIRELRGFDMTQNEFAQRIGISQSYLSAVEHGHVEAGAEVLLTISRSLGSSSSGFLPEQFRRQLARSGQSYLQEGLPESLVATGCASPAIPRQRHSSPSNCTAQNWPVCELALEIRPTGWV